MNPAEVFSALAARYGQTVEICRGGKPPKTRCRAFVQPLREGKAQKLPSPLGEVPQDRWRYLGEAGGSLAGMEEGYLLWQGQKFEVLTAHPICLGGQVSHWWALLKRRDPDGERRL